LKKPKQDISILWKTIATENVTITITLILHLRNGNKPLTHTQKIFIKIVDKFTKAPINGARVLISEYTGDVILQNQILLNDITNIQGTVETTELPLSNKIIFIRIRKGSPYPYIETVETYITISTEGLLDVEL
jgi:hypothetical protein